MENLIVKCVLVWVYTWRNWRSSKSHTFILAFQGVSRLLRGDQKAILLVEDPEKAQGMFLAILPLIHGTGWMFGPLDVLCLYIVFILHIDTNVIVFRIPISMLGTCQKLWPFVEKLSKQWSFVKNMPKVVPICGEPVKGADHLWNVGSESALLIDMSLYVFQCNQYSDVDTMASDMNLVFENAKQYNMDESKLYKVHNTINCMQ